MQMFEVLVGQFFEAIELYQSESDALLWLMPTRRTTTSPLTRH
jgi:hypothetical protein